MSKTWKVRVKQLRDTESNWASKNPVLLAGEMAFSSDRNGLFKVGDGKSKWSDLDYAEASSISWSNVTNRPTKLSAFTNDSGFITGVTKAMITGALGYTPPEEDTNTWRPIVDDLTSDSTFSSLSAYQGKVLKGLIDGKQAAGNYALKSEIPTSLPASDVYSWAKQSAKPSYSWSEIGSKPTALSSFTNDSGFITGITKAMVTTALGYTPPSTDTTYSDATTSAHGLMTAAMVTKLNGIATGATAVTDSTVSGWGYKKTDTNTWIALKGATTSAAGTAGYAPAPSAGAANRYLRSDGTWAVPPDTNTTYSKLSQFTNDSGFITGITKAMVTTALGYTPPSTDTNTTYTAGTGLGLSGTTFSVSYGSAAGTACQGNDSRLSDARPASDVYSWAKQSAKPSYSWSEIGSKPTALSSFTNDSGFITGIDKSMVTNALGYTPPTTDTTYSDATTSAHGLMTAAMVTKLNGIATGATAVTDSTVSGWGYKKTDNNTWIAFKGATTSAAGTAGYAPAPSAGAANRYLRSDGTWAVPPDTNTNTWRGIQNNLTSTSTTDSLSAAQGKALKDSLDSHTHSSLKIGSNTMNFVIGTSPAGLGSTSVVLQTVSSSTYSHIALATANFLTYAANESSLAKTFTVSAASGYTFNTSSYATVGIRIGKLCFVSFVLNTSIKGGAFYTVATIPTGYRPSKQTALIKQSNGSNDVSLIIDTSGNVKVYYYASTSSSTSGIHISATYSL